MRAPLSTLLGLLLARWLLACTHRLLLRLTPAVPEDVHDEVENVASEYEPPSYRRSRPVALIRRHVQRQQARVNALRARYVRWRETDTVELAQQLREQFDALRDGVVTSPQPVEKVSRKREVNKNEDWTEKVRRRGAHLVASPPPSQPVITEPSDSRADTAAVDSPVPPVTTETAVADAPVSNPPTAPVSNPPTEVTVTDSPVSDPLLPQASTEDMTPQAMAVLEKLRGARVGPALRQSTRQPAVIPVTRDAEQYFDRQADSNPVSPADQIQPKTPSLPTRPTVAQQDFDATRRSKTSDSDDGVYTNQHTAFAQPLPNLQRLASVPKDYWPSLSERHSHPTPTPAAHVVERQVNQEAAALWPSLSEANVPVAPRSEPARRRTARLQAEQRGTLWNG